jgi:hypothetical protein
MNYKKQAKQLESFLEEEVKKTMPLAVLPDNSIVYKQYKIKQNKQGAWNLSHLGGDFIEEFKIKTTATLAAKFYDRDNFTRYNEVKMLDVQYWTNATDASIFKYRRENTKDYDKRDLYTWRWEIADSRATHYKELISRMFKANF